MPEMVFEDIRILDKLESKTKWAEFVSGKNRHFMLLGKDEWPSKIVHPNNFFYNWHDDWNNNDYLGFSGALEKLEILDSRQVFIFWMREVAIETKWYVFRNYWINFLYEDEGVILVIPSTKKSLVLSNSGSWVGEREKSKT